MATSTPVSIVCVGMAGSGKTTFMQRINAHLHEKKTPPYVINLDPAVRTVPFESNIDIRDSVNYQEVMKSYNLGPNGGILTSLNLFATKIDQIVTLLEKRTLPDPAQPAKKPIEHILVDTPGQIEVFVWSASGSILLDSLASSFPTVVAYIIDTPRTASTSTFMSNMLYACSILYKTKLPMILVFNKTDVKDAEFAKEWMTDFEAFQESLRAEEEEGSFGGVQPPRSHSGPWAKGHLSVVGVSSMTGDGIDEFFEAVQEKAEEFNRDYKPELERRRKQRADEKTAGREKELGKLMKDMAVSGERSNAPEEKVDMDVISDLEDSSDSDANEGDEEEREEGLKSRYKEAMERSGGPTTDEDNSFTRYVRSSQMGM
ncbi:hypothetical protein O988_06595 [Pseudogymnoascus sp. VKM F-3808]|nr:hypothetical protein O988_06595 [Pseudogymnoascus sp. VKM F-3808]